MATDTAKNPACLALIKMDYSNVVLSTWPDPVIGLGISPMFYRMWKILDKADYFACLCDVG